MPGGRELERELAAVREVQAQAAHEHRLDEEAIRRKYERATSWKLTKPLRVGAHALRNARTRRAS
jgi:hypothetical protein